MFCKNCGKSITEEIIFCPSCGTKIAQDNETPQVKIENTKPQKKKKSVFQKILIGIGILIGLFIISGVIGSIKNTRPAEYIKDVTSYKEGSNAIVVYFTLADAEGKQTANNGEYNISIIHNKKEYIGYDSYSTDVSLYSATATVKESDFANATIGMGAFEHSALILSLGRIEYSQFSSPVSSGDKGEIKITFKSGGKTIESKETIYF